MWNIRFPYWLRPYLGAMKSFEIHPRQTDTYALLYNSSYISRLQFVICYHCYSTILQVRCVFLLFALFFCFSSFFLLLFPLLLSILQFEALHNDASMSSGAYPAFRHSSAARSMVPCSEGDKAARCSDSFMLNGCVLFGGVSCILLPQPHP